MVLRPCLYTTHVVEVAFCKVNANTLPSLLGSYVDIFPYMGTQCLNINPLQYVSLVLSPSRKLLY